MTQQNLADKLGISKQVMNKIIKGNKAINVMELSQIAAILGSTTDSVMVFADTKNGWYNDSQRGTQNEHEKRYDVVFKKELAQVYLNGLRTVLGLADELGLHVNTIYKWAEQFNNDPDNALPGSENMKSDEAEFVKAKRWLVI